MAIATVAGVLAGMQQPQPLAKLTSGVTNGRPHSLWAVAGRPGAGAYDTTLAGVALSSSSALVTGQIPHVNPLSGNAYVSRLEGIALFQGLVLLCDRLWHNGGISITSTTAQAITSAAFPARDANGSSNGEDVFLAVEVSSGTGTGTPTITISYTNSDGVSGRTGTNIDVAGSNSVLGHTYRIGLQAGDRGVRSVESITLSATWTSGTINLVAYRVLAALSVQFAYNSALQDALSGAFPRLRDGAVPYLMVVAPSGWSSFVGAYIESQG